MQIPEVSRDRDNLDIRIRVRGAALVVLVMVTLSGCAGGSFAAQIPSPSRSDSDTMKDSSTSTGPVISADYECGALSVLLTAQTALDIAPSQDSSSQSNRDFLQTAWDRVVVGDTPVSPELKKLVQLVGSGDMSDFERVAGQVSDSCSKNGSPIMVMGLPGEGG